MAYKPDAGLFAPFYFIVTRLYFCAFMAMCTLFLSSNLRYDLLTIQPSLNSREALRKTLSDNGVAMLSPIEVHIDTTTNRNSGIMDINNDYVAHPSYLPSTNPSLAESVAVFEPKQYAAPYDV
jgi:uncharacterized membrane protein YdfJ with MMPL/SSD domain